ncbi:MAG TPA: ATP-binding protein [Steroidobacteraceae bacterium]|jgi:anti-sigma regulatory factor (Ser/Thr protein kinase)
MNERHTTVPSDAAQLPALTQFLQDFWSANQLPATEAPKFELALEEVFMNVVMHGSQASQPRVDVHLALSSAGITLVVEDEGPAFDPLSVPPPDLAAIEQRPVGGLGVFLVRQLMDTVEYQRVRSRNRLRMTKRI